MSNEASYELALLLQEMLDEGLRYDTIEDALRAR